jgi:3-oxoacyl-[acyl-carrier-protein] synthase III
MIKAQFESLGVYLPDRVVSNQELIGQMPVQPLFDLEFVTGVKDRRWRSDEQDSYTIGMAAAMDCLKKSQYQAQDLDVIICASISHFKGGLNLWMKPDMSKFLKKGLGLRPDAMSFSITNACAGMLTGVHILNNMIKTGAVKNGMIISGECITPISETAVKEIKEPIDSQFASLTVGDSGVALIMDRATDENEGIDFIDLLTIANFADLCLAMPSMENPGMAMYTKALEIHQEVILRLPKIIKFMMNKHHFTGRDYDYVIPHQTSTRAIQTALELCTKHLQVLPEVLISIDKYGNTSSTSHFVVLHDHLSSKSLKKNSKVFFLALASGIVIGFVSATIGKLEACYGYNH